MGHEYVIERVTDLTELKETQEALVENEARFRRLLDNAPDIVYRLGAPARDSLRVHQPGGRGDHGLHAGRADGGPAVSPATRIHPRGPTGAAAEPRGHPAGWGAATASLDSARTGRSSGSSIATLWSTRTASRWRLEGIAPRGHGRGRGAACARALAEREAAPAPGSPPSREEQPWRS